MKARAITSDVKVELIEIGHTMNQLGISKPFIVAAVETAFEFEGVYDLMKMWLEEKVSSDRDEIIADIQDLINDCNQKEKVERVYVRFDDLDRIAKNIRAFKDSLRLKVDGLGGIGELSKKTGIPQPSLSRFFNSVSIPHRATLLKIAKALGLSQIEMITEWS